MPDSCPPPEALGGDPAWAPEQLRPDVSRVESELVRASREHGEAALTHIRDLLESEPDFAQLSATVYRETVWGSIRWRRALGHPAGDMHRAFGLDNQYRLIDGAVGSDGQVIDRGGWKQPSVPPRLWDGPHDDAYYRVSFMLRGVYPWYNRVLVWLDHSVPWIGVEGPSALAPQRRIQFPESLLEANGLFTVPKDGVTRLDELEVVRLLA